MLIADHFIRAEPVSPGSMVFKATRVNGSSSAVQVFPFELTVQQREHFAQQMILLAKATSDYRASIPELLSWGFTKSESFPYIETEWINGVRLDVKTIENGSGLSIRDVMVLVEQVSRTLSIFEQLGLQHGAVRQKHIIWERSRDRYVLVGFNLMNGVVPNYSTRLQHNDIYDFGLLLSQLLKAHANEINFSEAIENTSLGEQTPTEEKNIPTWLINTTRRSLSPDTKLRFGNAAELYNYVLSHHTTQVQKKSWYRSKPQQDIPAGSLRQEPTASSKELKTEQHLSPGQKKKRLLINPYIAPYIAGGLLIAVLIIALSMVAYRKDRAGINDPDTAIAKDSMGYQAGDTGTLGNNQNEKKPDLEKKRKTPAKKPKAVSVSEKDSNELRNPSSTGPALGAYQVKSKAHFHNQPDESTKRSAFIVHWNKAVLHPREERNDFVYIVFTNHEGQTSKGWLRKKDLVKVGE